MQSPPVLEIFLNPLGQLFFYSQPIKILDPFMFALR